MYGDNETSILTLNQTVNATSEKWELSFSATMATILSISSFLTLVGNTMVVTVVIKHPGMRTRTNLFLMNLALADFLVGLLPVPFAISTLIMGTWIFGDVLCTIVGFLNAFCLVASIHTLMYISIHKCYSITRPFSDPFKLRRILIMMAAAWLWAGFSATITVTGLTYVHYKPGTSQCGPQYPHDIKSYIHHYIIQATNIIIPLVIMIYCYGRMFYEIRKHAVRLQKNSTIEGDVLLAQQKRAFWTLFIVLACFIVCWLPYHGYASYLVITKSFKSTNFLRHFNPVAYMFGYINSACNPIIYALRSPSFRQGYKEILCRSSGYLISDETIGIQGENHSPLRRLSSFFTIKRSESTPECNNVGRKISTSSIQSADGRYGPKLTFKRGKSLTELMRTLPKTTKGSSVIRRDGSVVIMKAGKIVSVREAKNFTHGLPTMGRNTNGTPRFTNGNYKRDLHDEEYSNGFEMKTVLPATYPLSTIYSDSHIQLSESDGDQSSQEVPSSEVPDIIFDFEELDTELGASDIMTEEDNNILSKMPLTPHTKCELTKSAMCLKTESECANKTIPEKVSQKLKAASVSSLTRLRNLEISSIFGKSGSDKKLNLYGSPLLLRRLENRKSSLPLLGNQASEM